MKGLLYKDLVQNKLLYIFGFIIPIISICIFVLILGNGENYYSVGEALAIFNEKSAAIAYTCFYSFMFMIIDLIITKSLDCDEIKKWAYFISSSPKLARGQVFMRYLSVLFQAVLMAVSFYLVEIIVCAWGEASLGVEMSDFGFFGLLFLFVELFMKSIEIPFIVCFGAKKGDMVRVAMLIILFIFLLVYILFGPLPIDFDTFLENVVDFIGNLRNGVYDHLFNRIKLISASVVTVMFVLSYFISTKLYLKGVESYDK